MWNTVVVKTEKNRCGKYVGIHQRPQNESIIPVVLAKGSNPMA